MSGNSLFYHHAEFVDWDGDGIKDLVTVGEKKGLFDDGEAHLQWFKGNTSADRFEKTPITLNDGLGSIPTVMDIDNDGDLDIMSAQFFGAGPNEIESFIWYERIGTDMTNTASFTKHVINGDSGRSIQLSMIPNLCGDGITRAVGANHENTAKDANNPQEAVYMFDIPADPKQPWAKTKISDGIKSVNYFGSFYQGAPGVFGWGDADGDGDIDIAVSGDGDPNIYLLEQTSACIFKTSILGQNLSQAGVTMGDLDNDGVSEIVAASYGDNELVVFKKKSPAKAAMNVVENNSFFGTIFTKIAAFFKI